MAPTPWLLAPGPWLLALLLAPLSGAHVIFKEPPSRASIGHYRHQCKLPVDYNHMSLFCGGAGTQHNVVNKGRCGVCGDTYFGHAREHEAGGRYATGTIARSYRSGQLIDVEVELVANHKGIFTWAICPHNDMTTVPSRDCFIANHLELAGASHDLYHVHNGDRKLEMQVQLPVGMVCSQCVLQFTYTAGNNEGLGPQSAEVVTDVCVNSKVPLLGCGPQETFRGCADICIGDFCPHHDQDTCIKAKDVIMTLPPVTRPPTLPPVTRPPTMPPVTKPPTLPGLTLPPIATPRPPTSAPPRPPTQPPTQTPDLTLPPIATSRPPTSPPSQGPATSQCGTSCTWLELHVPPGHEDSICRIAGIVPELYSAAGEQFCRSFCLNKTVRRCYRIENLQKLCYCVGEGIFIYDPVSSTKKTIEASLHQLGATRNLHPSLHPDHLHAPVVLEVPHQGPFWDSEEHGQPGELGHVHAHIEHSHVHEGHAPILINTDSGKVSLFTG